MNWYFCSTEIWLGSMKKMSVFILAITAFLLMARQVQGQPAFINVASEVGTFSIYSPLPFYAGGMSFRDFDNDGWDDLTICTGLGEEIKFYKNVFGTFKPIELLQTNLEEHHNAVWIDYDNDNDLDFFGISDLGGIEVFRNDGALGYSNITSFLGLNTLVGIHLRGITFGDFNNDGLVDVYVCCYDPFNSNKMYFQNPNNTFQDVTVLSGTEDSIRFSHDGLVLDYNQDGWLDLYVANDGNLDRNTLFKNNGDSTFTDVSTATGSDIYIDAMGMTLGDFDGDLDLDIHVTDRTDSKLIRLDSNSFTEVASLVGADHQGGFGWGNNFFDADLDGDEDLYISCSYASPLMQPSILCVNDGQGAFSYTSIGNDSNYSFTNILGDFNNDRLTDIAVLNTWGQPINIWKNVQSNPPPRITLKLEGCTTHQDATGSEVLIYDGPQKRLYAFQTSQSFLGQNSEKRIIPILNNTQLDSILIKWPSGIQTTLYEINPNQTIIASECSGHKPLPVILAPNYHDQGLTICGEDSILLAVNGNYPSVTWSNGETSDSIYVISDGTYTVSVTNQFGESAISSPVTINTLSFPQFTIVSEPSSCFNNGEIEIVQNDTTHAYQYAWSAGDTTRSINGLSPGTYAFTVTNEGECPVIDSFFVEGPQSYSPMHIESTTLDALCYGEASGIIDLTISGGFEPYSFEWNNGMSESSISVVAGTHRVTVTDSFGCQKDTLFIIDQPDLMLADIQVTPDTNLLGLGSIEMIVMGGTPPYSIFWSDSANQTGPVAANLRAGNYNASIVDANFCQREIPIKVTNVNTTGQTAAFNTSCSVKCVNQAQSILVSFHENCEAINSTSEIDVFNMHGQKIRRTLNAIDAHTIELFTEQNGIIFIDAKQGGTCKVVRL